MMLRVLLVASLSTVAFAFIDYDSHLEVVGDQYGCCASEDHREIQYLWQTIRSSSFTHYSPV